MEKILKVKNLEEQPKRFQGIKIEIKIEKEFKELKELEEDVWSFKIPRNYYTPHP